MMDRRNIAIGAVLAAVVIVTGYWWFSTTQRAQLTDEVRAGEAIFSNATYLLSRYVPEGLTAVESYVSELIGGAISTGHSEVIASSSNVNSTIQIRDGSIVQMEKIVILADAYPVKMGDRVFSMKYRLIRWDQGGGSMFICFITDRTFQWQSSDRGRIEAHGVGYSRRVSESWDISAMPSGEYLFAIERDIPTGEGQEYVLTVYRTQELSDAKVFAIYFRNCEVEIISFGYAMP